MKIWWDGGSAITCTFNHLSSVREIKVFVTQDATLAIISRCWVGSLRVWDVKNGKCLGNYEYPRSKTKIFSTCMDISEIASLIALGTASGSITVISTLTLEILQEILPSNEEILQKNNSVTSYVQKQHQNSLEFFMDLIIAHQLSTCYSDQ